VSLVLWRCSFGIRKSIWPVKGEWWGIGVVICLERGADCLHLVDLMPLHPKTLSPLASFKSRLVLPFWYQLTQVVLKKRPFTAVCSSSSSSRYRSSYLPCHVCCKWLYGCLMASFCCLENTVCWVWQLITVVPPSTLIGSHSVMTQSVSYSNDRKCSRSFSAPCDTALDDTTATVVRVSFSEWQHELLYCLSVAVNGHCMIKVTTVKPA